MPGSGKHNVNNIDSFFKVRPSRTTIREGETISFLEKGNLVKQEKRNGVVYETVYAEQGAKKETSQSTIVSSGASSSGDITSVTAGTGLTGGGLAGPVTLDVVGGTGITANANDIAIDSTVVTLTGTQTLTNKTLTAPTLTGTTTATRINLGSTDTSSFLTGDPKISATGYMMIQGIINETETGSAPAGIVFGNNSTYGNDEISLITAGQNRLYINSSGNITISQDLTITGDLTVQGDTTTLNTATLQVEDKNIVMNYHATNDTSGSADGAGITIQDAVNSTTDATMLWDATNDEFDFSHTVTAPSFTGDLTGNADTATKWAAGVDINLSGDVAGSTGTVLDGSGDVTIGATIQTDAVEAGMLNDNIISGQTAITSGLADTDELLLSDAGVLKKVDISVLESKFISGIDALTLANFNSDVVIIDSEVGSVTRNDSRFLTASATESVIESYGYTTNTGTVTSVAVSGGNGLTSSGGPITTSGTITLAVGAGTGIATNANDIELDINSLASSPQVVLNGSEEFAVWDPDYNTSSGQTSKLTLDEVSGYVQAINFTGTNDGVMTKNPNGTLTAEANLTFDGLTSTLAVTGDQTLSGVLKSSSNGDNRLTLDDDSDSSNVNQVTLAGVNNVNILIDGTNNGVGDFQIRSRPTTANDLDTADIIVDIDETTATFDNITSQVFQIGNANRFKILETGVHVQNSSLGVGIAPIDGNARIQAASHIEAGVGSGAIGLTINDGGGNSNVTFNHTGRVPEQNGNSGRIEVNTDGIGNQYMAFELAGNVTSGVTVATTEIARINSTGLQSSLSGTAASPALRVNDSDTGLYRIADDKLGISTAGTFAVAVDASQNVGIGTSTPLSKLHIEESTNDADALMIRQTAGGSGSVQGKVHIGMNHFNSTNPSVRITAEELDVADYRGNLAFSTRAGTSDVAPTEKMRITHDGNVGIGELSPDRKLHITGSENELMCLESTDTNTDLIFADTGGSVRVRGASGNFDVYTGGTASSTSASGSTYAFRIESDGDFRLRTPEDKRVYIGDGNEFSIRHSSAGYNLFDSSHGHFYLRNTISNQNIYFGINDGGTTVYAMTVHGSSSNIGIGTTSPVTNLHISSSSAQTDNDGMLKVEQTSTSSGSAATNAGINTKNYHGTSQFLQWEEHGLRIGSRILTNSGTGDVIFTAGADSEKMRILAGGNVGIGTQSPGTKLHVQNGATSYTWTPYAGTTAMFEGTSSNHSIVSIVGSTTGQSSIWFGDTDHQSIGRVRYEHTNNQMEFWTNGIERVAIDSSGNVGINQGSRLYLDGTALTGDTYIASPTSDAIDILAGNNKVATLTSTYFEVSPGTSNIDFIVDDSSGVEAFKVDSGTGNTIVANDLTVSGTFALSTLNVTTIKNNDSPADTAMTIDSNGRVTFSGGPTISSGGINVTGASTMGAISMSGGNLSNVADITLTSKLYLDGGSDTYIHQSSNDIMQLFTGGENMLELSSAGSDPRISYFNKDNRDRDFSFCGDSNDHVLYFDASAERVGIGTSTPSNLLHLDGTYPQLRLNASGDTTYTTFGSGTSFAVFNIVNPSTKTYEFRNNGTAQLTIDTSGNVGIGQASPGYKLDVNGTSGLRDNVTIFDDKTLYVGSDLTNGLRLFHLSSNNNNYIRSNGGALSVQTIAAQPLYLVTNNTTAMTIDSSQNVGIGCTPTGKLNVELPQYTSRDSDAQHSIFSNSGDTGKGLRIGYDNSAHKAYVNVLDPGVAWGDLILQDGAGKIGIGTASPQRKFHVSTGNTDIAARFENTTSNGSVAEFISSGDSRTLTIQTDHIYSNGNLFFGLGNYTNTYRAGTHIFQEDTGNAEVMRITGNNVGIGVTSPLEKLHVAAPATQSLKNALHLSNNPTDTSNAVGNGVAMTMGLLDGAYSTKIATVYEGNNPSYLQPALAFYTMHNTYLAGSETEKMRISSSGNVGIGTSSPSYKLHLEQAGGVMQQLKATDSNQAYMKFVNSATGDGQFTDGFLFGLDSDESVAIWNYEGTAMRFATAGTERMRINSSGCIKVGPNGGDTAHTFEIDTSGNANHGLFVNADEPRGAGDYALYIDDEDPNGRGTMVIENASGDGLKITTQGQYTGLELVANNDGSNPAKTCHINMTGYESRANGIFYFDANKSGEEWFSGIRYAGNFDDWVVGYDETGGQGEYVANAKMLVDHNGNFHADADVVAFSSTTGSDRRLKKNIKDLPYGLDDVLKLRAVEFDWKEKRGGKHDIGVIAQEIQEVIPEVVSEVRTIGKSSEELESHLSVDYGKIVSVLIKAVQEQQEQINELEEKLNG